MDHILKLLPAWILALVVSSAVLAMSLIAFVFLGRYEGMLSNSLDLSKLMEQEDTLLLVQGKNPLESMNTALQYLYGEEEDSFRIAEAVIDSFLADIVLDDSSPQSLLDTFGDAPFTLSIRQENDGSYAWGFSVPSGGIKESLLIQKLHRGFADRFSLGEIRTRTLPGGTVMQDIIASDSVVLSESEKWREFTILRSTHQNTGESFLTAEGQGITVFANNREVLVSLLRNGLPNGKNTLLLHRSALEALSEVLPDSDTFRFVRSLFTDQDDVLSLSSFRCIP
ncbi:MAG TPA: hypothetical protein VJB82_05135 [Candidatus Peribacterales bacterium]|nr:hypothetical protein [Candidatus Peribacterales bacterium]